MHKLKGGGLLPPKPNFIQLTKGLIGGFLGILCLGILSYYTGVPWLMAPFGATCVLLFAAPNSPFAQPRNVIIGHFVTSFVGLIGLYLFGQSIWVISLSVGFAIMLMQYLRAVHPPAGANPIVILLAGKSSVGFEYLIMHVLIGSVSLVAIAIFVNNIGARENWPNYWLGGANPK